MLSSIWVATITGLPARRQSRIIFFWIGGSSEIGISTPRSPRATMMPSTSERISANRCTAAGFSTLTMIAARSPMISRASLTSSGRCTKLSATQSTPRSSRMSRSWRSFSVSAASGSTTSGTLTPLLFEISPPAITSQSAWAASQVSTLRRTLPSLTRSVAPGSSAAKISGWGRCTRVASPGDSSRSKRKR